MLETKNVLAPFGIVALCGMFLMGQETWYPEPTERYVSETGITLCYDDSQQIACPSVGEPFFGQDAQYVTNPMSFTDNGDGTVTDNVTGFMWQKEDDNLKRNWEDAQTYCSNLTLGGLTHWRLPLVSELQTIVDYGLTDPSIDTTVFSGATADRYWTISEAIGSGNLAWAWFVRFEEGNVTTLTKGWDFYIRCVRGDPATHSYTDHGDGTVTDDATGLMWQKEDEDGVGDWQTALSYCEDLTLAGYTDWKLPDIRELMSIVDYDVRDPAIDSFAFPGTDSENYWSSSPSTSARYAWYIDFYNGAVTKDHHKSYSHYIRCVR